MRMEPAEAWNKALRENMLSPNLSPYERLVNIREHFGLSGPHEFQYFPEYNPVTPAYEDMLFAPADWQKREVQP
jgi:hypothetical protein